MRIVVTGAAGQLGAYVAEELAAAGHEEIGWSRRPVSGRAWRPVELTDSEAVRRALDEDRPEAVVHLAAISAYEAVARDPAAGEAVNVGATRRLAEWCGSRGRPLIFTSTDAVFDGLRGGYREDDPARPVLAYGRTKLAAEAPVLALGKGLVARLPLLYGPSFCGREGFFDRSIGALRRGEPVAFFEDEYRTPLDYATAARTLRRLLETRAVGLLHVAGPERLSRYALMRRSAAALGIDAGLVRPNRRADVASSEPRPADTSLDTTRLAAWLPDLRRPTVEEALARR